MLPASSSVPRLMSCPSEASLVQFADGALSAEAAAEVRAHLEHCADCRLVISALTSSTGATLPGTTVHQQVGEQLSAGSRLGRYEVLRFLGAGAMGEVYLARDASLKRDVAVKVLRGGGSGEAALHARLMREAQAMARLSHPNVVSVYEVGDQSGVRFVAMEYVDGAPLSDWLETPRTWQQVVRVFLDAGQGLGAAHARGLIHRDFKPDNVLIDREGRVRVADFGLAAEASQPTLTAPTPGALDVRLTQTGALLGTPAYMDAGMLQGQPSSAASDQFAFCIALAEGITGTRPMDATTLSGLVLARLEGPPVDAPRGVPSAVWRVLRRGLSVDPGARFASMQDLLAELSTALRPWPRAGRLVLAAVVLVLAGAGAARHFTKQTPVRFADLSMANASTEQSRQRFKQAMQALATGVGDERGPLVEALRDDPSFSEAALQLAFLAGTEAPGSARDLTPWHQAQQRKATLTPRDQSLLDALGPTFSDPPDWREAERRFSRLVEQWPGDAQLWGGLGSIRYLLGSDVGALDAFRAARQLDGACTWGLSKDARRLFLEGHRDEAHALLERCLATTPGQTACAHRLGSLHNVEGQCSALDALARDMVRLNPSAGKTATWTRLAALHGLGTPKDVVAEYLRGDVGAALDPTQLAMWRTMAEADFQGFLAVDLTQGARPPPPTEAVFMKTQALLELGSTEQAKQLVLATLRSADVLERPVDLSSDATPYLLGIALREGWLPFDEVRQRRAAWVEQWRKRLEGPSWNEYRQLVWLMAWTPARMVSPGLAAEAFVARESFGPAPPLEFFQLKSLEDGHPYLEDYGVLLLAMGRLAEAEDALSRASAFCGANLLLVPNAGAALMLAQVRQKRGDTVGACQALQVVEREWGNASSTTAQRAKAQFNGLACDELLSAVPKR